MASHEQEVKILNQFIEVNGDCTEILVNGNVIKCEDCLFRKLPINENYAECSIPLNDYSDHSQKILELTKHKLFKHKMELLNEI